MHCYSICRLKGAEVYIVSSRRRYRELQELLSASLHVTGIYQGILYKDGIFVYFGPDSGPKLVLFVFFNSIQSYRCGGGSFIRRSGR
jgi:hypothetical protein